MVTNRDVARLLSELPDFSLAVQTTNKGEVDTLMRRIYVYDIDTERRRIFPLDPGILLLVNTHGCQQRALLCMFADPMTFVGFEKRCRCSNCVLAQLSPGNSRGNISEGGWEGAGPREPITRLAPPPEIRVMDPRKNYTITVYKKQKETPAIKRLLEERARMTEIINQLADERDADYNVRLNFNFSFRRTTTYLDTCAYASQMTDKIFELEVQEEVEKHLKVDRQKYIEELAVSLFNLRHSIYVNSSLSAVGVRLRTFFPDAAIVRLSVAGGTGKIKTLSDIQKALPIAKPTSKAKNAVRLHLPTSLLGGHQERILAAMHPIIERMGKEIQARQDQTSTTTSRKGGRKRMYDDFVPVLKYTTFDPMNNPNHQELARIEADNKRRDEENEKNAKIRKHQAAYIKSEVETLKRIKTMINSRLKIETSFLDRRTKRVHDGTSGKKRGVRNVAEGGGRRGGNDVDDSDVDMVEPGEEAGPQGSTSQANRASTRKRDPSSKDAVHSKRRRGRG